MQPRCSFVLFAMYYIISPMIKFLMHCSTIALVLKHLLKCSKVSSETRQIPFVTQVIFNRHCADS